MQSVMHVMTVQSWQTTRETKRVRIIRSTFLIDKRGNRAADIPPLGVILLFSPVLASSDMMCACRGHIAGRHPHVRR